MIVFLVLLYARNDCGCPLNDEVFEPVALIKVRVHELFHSLARQLALFALLIKSCLLLVDVIDEVAQLSQREDPLV